MIRIDCLGDICPIPVMRLQAVLPAIGQGEDYLIVTDHSCSLTAIRDFCKGHRLRYAVNEPTSGVWEIAISKSCPPKFSQYT